MSPEKIGQLQTLYSDKRHSVPQICKTLNISRATLYRYVTPREPSGEQPEQ